MAFKIDFDVADEKVIKLSAQIDKLGEKASKISKELEQSAKQLAPSYAKMKKELAEVNNKFEQLKRTQEKLNKSQSFFTKNQKSLDSYSKAAATASVATAKQGAEAGKAAAKNKHLEKSFLDSAQGAAAFRAMMNATGTHMGIFTGHTIAMATAVYGMVTAIKSTITVGTDFTAQMTRALPVMGATVTEAKLLEQEVRRLGETTKFTATEAAGGLTALAMAGLSSDQSIQALSSTLNLASIGQIDMYRSADILTNVMTGFRLEAEDTVKITDDLATAITTSNSTIEQMANALSYVAPVAAAAGGEIEEVTAMLEVFHNAGIKGSRAGTGLRRAYANLQAPSKKSAEVIKELGITVTDINGNMLELSTIMKQLADNGATSADMIKLFGVRAAPAMMALLADLKSVNSEFEIFRTGLENNANAADDLRKAMEDNLGSDAKKLLSALQEQALKMFEVWEDGLRNTVQGLTEFVKSIKPETINDLAESLQWAASSLVEIGKWALYAAGALAAIKLGGFAASAFTFAKGLSIAGLAATKTAAGVAILTGATGTLALVTGTAATATKAFTVALLSNPVVLGTLAVGAAAYGIYKYIEATEEATVTAKKLSDEEIKLKVEREKDLKTAEKLIQFEKNRTENSDKFLSKTDKEIAVQVKKRQEAERQIKLQKELLAMQKYEIGLGSMQHEEVILDVIAGQTAEINRINGEILEKKKAAAYYELTGLDPEGVRKQERLADKLRQSLKKDFDGIAEDITDSLGNSLDKIKSDRGSKKITVVEALVGTRESVRSAFTQLDSEFEKGTKDLLQTLQSGVTKREDKGVSFFETADISILEQLKKGLKDKNFSDGITMTDEAAEAFKELIAIQEEYVASREDIDKVNVKTNEGFDKFINSVDKIIDSSSRSAEKLIEEISVLEGVEVASKSAAEAKIDSALAILKAEKATKAFSQASAEERAEIEDKISSLDSLKSTLRGLTDELETLKNHDQGFGLSEEQVAISEYDKKLKALDEYSAAELEIIGGKTQRIAELERELSDELSDIAEARLRDQHELYFGMADTAAESIGENIAQVALLDQSWSEAGTNIRRAIVGGLIQTIAEYSIKRGALFLAEMMWSNAEQAESIKTATVKVAAKGVEAGGVVAANEAIIISNTKVMATEAGASLGVTIPMQTMAMTALIGIVSGLLGGLAGSREIGGPVMAGHSYLVGEKGPEIFTPTATGKIDSNINSRAMMSKSGGEVNNHYYDQSTTNYVDAIDTQTFQSALSKQGNFVTAMVDRKKRNQGRKTR